MPSLVPLAPVGGAGRELSGERRVRRRAAAAAAEWPARSGEVDGVLAFGEESGVGVLGVMTSFGLRGRAAWISSNMSTCSPSPTQGDVGEEGETGPSSLVEGEDALDERAGSSSSLSSTSAGVWSSTGCETIRKGDLDDPAWGVEGMPVNAGFDMVKRDVCEKAGEGISMSDNLKKGDLAKRP